jgi:O-antigen/teichoic acid export membrane protein
MRAASNALAVLLLKGAAPPLQFLLLVLTARWFGVAVRGEIALFTAAVNLFVLIVGFTGGSSIVYLASRDPSRALLGRILTVSYSFCVLVPVALAAVASGMGRPVSHETPLVVWVAVMNALLVVHVCVMMSGHAVWQATLLEFLRPFTLVSLAVLVAWVRGFRTPGEFFVVWAVAATVAFLLSVPFVLAHRRRLPPRGAGAAPEARQVLRDLLGYGFLAQASNFTQFLNYRGLFFALERSVSVTAVGLFSTAVSFAEILWIPANSLAAVTLNRVTRSGAAPETRPFVLRMARLALVATASAALLIALVPRGWITALLGPDFGAVRQQLLVLLPGVIAIGISVIASAYHAGNGLYRSNLFAALSGLLPTLVGMFVLVPWLGARGATIAMNASYLFTASVLIASLARRERVRPGELVPRPGDLPQPLARPT